MRSGRLTVAVTGMNAVPDNPGPGLAVARCLRAAFGSELRIVGLGYDALDPGLYQAEFCDVAYLLSYPLHGADALLARLAEIDAAERIDVLIPCLDAELPLMVALSAALAALGMRVFLPEAGQLQRRAKDRLPELAASAGIACPEVRPLSHAGFFQHCHLEGWNYPLVVKGVFYDAHVVHNAQEAAAAFRHIADGWGLPVLVQRFVAGEEHNLTAVGDGRGALLGEVMMKKRAVTSKGKAWAGVATNDDQLAQAARKLVAALSWRGPLEVEMMRDAQGIYHLIEINPRFPAWIYLSAGVGRNLPALLVDLALGRPPRTMPPHVPGTLFIRHAEETIVPLAAFEDLVVRGNSNPA